MKRRNRPVEQSSTFGMLAEHLDTCGWPKLNNCNWLRLLLVTRVYCFLNNFLDLFRFICKAETQRKCILIYWFTNAHNVWQSEAGRWESNPHVCGRQEPNHLALSIASQGLQEQGLKSRHKRRFSGFQLPCLLSSVAMHSLTTQGHQCGHTLRPSIFDLAISLPNTLECRWKMGTAARQ